MHITIENLPILFLIIAGIGVVIVVIGILRLASIHEIDESYYIKQNNTSNNSELQELFSYFLEEEEKKNNQFREMVLGASKQGREAVHAKAQDASSQKKPARSEEEMFAEVIRRYEDGEDAASIAKNLKRGIGEVKLIISLYAMR